VDSRAEQINRLKTFFQTQRLTVLATQEPGHPYLSLMAYILTDDLKYLVAATKRGTRKYSNIIKTPGVAFLVDNRTNQGSDFRNTLAVTGIGTAEEIKGPEKESLIKRFLETHPELDAFVRSPECALIKIKIDKYVIIHHFQEAEELEMT
jgi:nitroimidazol reductase NimA-like FMN-containing flavoprotein (pyridoxamine 5'-phosphate oxidase superfamily)